MYGYKVWVVRYPDLQNSYKLCFLHPVILVRCPVQEPLLVEEAQGVDAAVLVCVQRLLSKNVSKARQWDWGTCVAAKLWLTGRCILQGPSLQQTDVLVMTKKDQVSAMRY